MPALERRGVGFLLQGRLLDFELHDAALHLVDFLRNRIDLDAQAGRGLVDEVDGLVGEEAITDVAVGERGGGHDGAIGDAHPVVRLVAFLEAAQDGDGALHTRFAHEDGLEAPLEGGVLLHVQAVLVEGGGAHHAQLATGKHGLEHVPRVHAALGLARPHERVQFVDEDDVEPFGAGDFLEHRLEALLELAAELGASNEGAKVERHELLVLETLGHVAAHDALGEPLGDGGLAHAGFANEHGVVLGATGQHLDDATDFLVATNDRIELALAGAFGEIARELLQRLILLLGALVGDLVRAAHQLEGVEQRLTMGTDAGEHAGAVGALGIGERQQQVLGAHVLVAERLGFTLGGIDDLREFPAERGLGVALPGVARRLLLGRRADGRDIGAHPLQHRDDDAFVLRQQGQQQMQIVDEWVAVLAGQRHGVVERLGALHGETVGIDHAVTRGNEDAGCGLPYLQGAGGRKPEAGNRRVTILQPDGNVAESHRERRQERAPRVRSPGALLHLVHRVSWCSTSNCLLHHDHLLHQRHAIHLEAIQIHA